ncbi:hypothetical protein D3C80_1599470 [compost metagenome]
MSADDNIDFATFQAFKNSIALFALIATCKQGCFQADFFSQGCNCCKMLSRKNFCGRHQR